MASQRFEVTRDAPGRLVKTPQGLWAFVPDPLPPRLEVSWDLVSALSAADRAVAELAGVGGTLPNPHLLVGPFVRREAVLSSRIEGTQASLSDLFFFEAAPKQYHEPGDVREVANYVDALEYGLKRIETLPISLRLVRELHEHLMAGVRGGDRSPGEFRRVQSWIGREGCTVDEATYVPPPPHEITSALGDFERFIHASSGLPPLVRFALLHYQFEAIHPFLDGNGRIGRLLITLEFGSEGLLPQPLLYLSDFFERNRPEYYRLLLAVTTHGEWGEWIRFFLRGVAEQSRDAVLRARKLLALRQELREKLQAARASALLLRLVDELFQYPAITMRRTASALKVTPRAAQMNLDKLIDAGIIVEATGRERNRVYVARRIIHAIEHDG